MSAHKHTDTHYNGFGFVAVCQCGRAFGGPTPDDAESVLVEHIAGTCPECGLPREAFPDMGTGETGYICETGCIQDEDVALDPEPWESNGNRYPVERHRAFGVADFSPRSEFNQDREAYR